jgi:hypothetical protein
MRSFRLLCSALLMAPLLLPGCAPGNSRTVCPPLATYSPETQERAADELETLPIGSALGQMLADYAALRGEIRACR